MDYASLPLNESLVLAFLVRLMLTEMVKNEASYSVKGVEKLNRLSSQNRSERHS